MKTKINLARTLIAAIDAGSIAAGARALNMTRSAASKNVATLELALGTPLLRRSSKKLSLTEAGEIYVRGLRSALADIDAVESDVSAFSETPTGVLTIESSVLFGKFFLAEIIRNYLRAYPKMTIDLRLSDGQADVASGEVDIYFRTGRVRHMDMIATKILDIRFKTVVAPEYLAKKGAPENVDALSRHNCLNFRFPADHSVFQWQFKLDNEVIYRRFAGNLISTDAQELRKSVLAADGISQLPNQLVDTDIEQGALVELFPETVYVVKSLYMCLQRSRRNDAKLLSFSKFLKATSIAF